MYSSSDGFPANPGISAPTNYIPAIPKLNIIGIETYNSQKVEKLSPVHFAPNFQLPKNTDLVRMKGL